MGATEPGSAANLTWWNWANEDSTAPHWAQTLQTPPPTPQHRALFSVTAASKNQMLLLLPPSVTRMESRQPLLPPVAGYADTSAAGRVGLEYLTFQLLVLDRSTAS